MDGYWVRNNVLTQKQVEELRLECDAVYRYNTVEKKRDVVEMGCVVDILYDAEIPESHPARTDQKCYLELRNQELPASASSTSPNIEIALFQTLPSHCFEFSVFKQKSPTAVFLFNEHYVVKPAETSDVEFSWHRDDEKQLPMLSTDPEHYISAWCPLDDISAVNGALQLQSLADPDKTITPYLSAGSVIFFQSNVWHCSAPNTSLQPRRVFYAQYSSSPILASSNDPFPLCMAVPTNVNK